MSPGEARSKPGSAGPPILTTEVTDRRRRRDLRARARAWRPGEVGEDGWLRTSDVGRLDEEGYLYVLGRADDVIVTGGKNVSPAEVEQVLLEHPAVADAGGARRARTPSGSRRWSPASCWATGAT